jgi:hypothetical protein
LLLPFVRICQLTGSSHSIAVERRLFRVWSFIRRSACVASKDEYRVRRQNRQTFLCFTHSGTETHGQCLRSAGVDFPTVATQVEIFSGMHQLSRDKELFTKIEWLPRTRLSNIMYIYLQNTKHFDRTAVRLSYEGTGYHEFFFLHGHWMNYYLYLEDFRIELSLEYMLAVSLILRSYVQRRLVPPR